MVLFILEPTQQTNSKVSSNKHSIKLKHILWDLSLWHDVYKKFTVWTSTGGGEGKVFYSYGRVSLLLYVKEFRFCQLRDDSFVFNE